MEAKKRYHSGLKRDIVTFADEQPAATKDIARSRTTWPLWIFLAVIFANLFTIPASYFLIEVLNHYFLGGH